MDRSIPGGTWWLLNGCSVVEPGMVSGIDPIPAMAAMPQWEPDPCSWPREHGRRVRLQGPVRLTQLVRTLSASGHPTLTIPPLRPTTRRTASLTDKYPDRPALRYWSAHATRRPREETTPGHRVEQDTCRNRVPALLSDRTYEMVSERTEVSRSATSAQFTMFHRAVT